MRAEARFRAMGSDVHVMVVDGEPSLLDLARERIGALEDRWSRFRPTSEVSLLNALAGRPVRVGADTFTLVRLALDGAWRTAGRYDPTILGPVIRAGYERSFERIDVDAPPSSSDLTQGFAGIRLDADGSTVTLPEHVGFDPGGIGKGLAADLVSEDLIAMGAAGVCVNIGGDLRADGRGPDGGAWVVAIEDPFGSAPDAVIGLASGGVATGARTRRVLAGGHHLIDPATGLPAAGGLASVTAIAGRAWQAEVAATASFVAGARDCLAVLESLGADGLRVDDARGIAVTSGFDRFMARAAPAP